ncbi:hypothetical protein CONPUDRAFT_155610 [Coniophora puteana RWD-64-598 SS2]|uniref:Uncharacterized protein n=1 Tax=Coniophora puteana (strain RWD-64-598) TaxID=741705 RepID=A0A5M3MJS9_CONPW|nr:uncharacterized protein CONPUDRAFT_155610 [Coniophora puteana RWD-64-598 SS2]EIW78905.1 hypothetical protein CONPUDRAFT_155610 [Coniophora puteana RWD-64-598 SS2]
MAPCSLSPLSSRGKIMIFHHAWTASGALLIMYLHSTVTSAYVNPWPTFRAGRRSWKHHHKPGDRGPVSDSDAALFASRLGNCSRIGSDPNTVLARFMIAPLFLELWHHREDHYACALLYFLTKLDDGLVLNV